MEKQWMIAYPRQPSGDNQWFHIENLFDAGEIQQACLGYLETHEVMVYTICNNDFRKWVINSQQKIIALYWYLKNSVNTDDLKLRLQVKQK